MPSTYTTSLQLQKIGNGEQSGIWGTTTNTNWDLIEQAVAGVQNITMLNADYTLTVVNGASDEARNMVIVAGGTNSAIRKIIAPLAPKVYIVNNNTSGGYAITIGGASGSAVTIPSGVTLTVYCDGTNFYTGASGTAGNFTIPGDLAVNGSLTVTGLTNIIPAGVIQMWPTASPPTGFLICNGASLSTVSYPNLFSAIGYTFGGSSGTFLLPDYRNRMPIGVGTTASLAGTGGSNDAIVVSHTHTASTTATDSGHTHTITDPGHTHTTSASQLFFQSSPSSVGPGSNYRVSGTTIDSASTGITGTNSGTANISASTTVTSSGSSGTNANLPPYLGINFIIKT